MSRMESMVTSSLSEFFKKIPEWLLPEEVTLDMAKRLIAYKQNIGRMA